MTRAGLLPKTVERYLGTRAAAGPWRIEGNRRDDFAAAVVIPALAEEKNLGATLASLAANPPDLLARCLVVVVVNHPEDAAPADRKENRRTLKALSQAKRNFPGLQLAWIDAASAGRELPTRRGGVGLARKIGFDLALRRLDYFEGEPLLVALDADTLVCDNYLHSILAHFAVSPKGGAVLPFRHQPGRTAAEDRAIVLYELYLRSYVLGLSLAGSPYAFHTVGSTIACRAEAYVRAGGMNRRRAGEDFYFLQQLAKTAGIAALDGTVVYPSARPSARTPFGTGPSVSRLLAGDDGPVRFYSPKVFRILADWLGLAESGWRWSAAELLDRAGSISEALPGALVEFGFEQCWDKLQRNHPRRDRFMHAFHGWFDGLRTLQLIRRICISEPPVSSEEAVAGLLLRAGLESAASREDRLALLRRHQGAEINLPQPF